MPLRGTAAGYQCNIVLSGTNAIKLIKVMFAAAFSSQVLVQVFQVIFERPQPKPPVCTCLKSVVLPV